jgi:hypothetical protein
MNYVGEVFYTLKMQLPGCAEELLDLYTLLAMTTGEDTTLENIHDAWAVWQNGIDPQHRSLVPFEELSKPVQELDRKYMEAVHLAACECQA